MLQNHLNKGYRILLAWYSKILYLFCRLKIVQQLMRHPQISKNIKKWQQAKREFKIVIIGVSCFVFWMFSGLFASDQPEVDRTKGDLNHFYKIENFQAKKMPISVEVWGTAIASNHLTIYSQVFGKVVNIIVKPGTCLAAGDPILSIEQSNKPEELLKAQADFNNSQRKYDTIRKLYDKGLSSKLELEAATTAITGAKSALSLAEDQLAKTTVSAPFAGCIDDIKVKVGEILGPNHNTIGDFADLRHITVETALSLREVKRVSTAKIATVKINDQKELQGKVKFLGQIGNSQNHTFTTKLEFDNQDSALTSGEIVYAKIIGKEQMVQQIPHSALVASNDGQLRAAIVENGIARHVKLDILGESEDKITVAGLPHSIDLITMGQMYIKNGDKIE